SQSALRVATAYLLSRKARHSTAFVVESPRESDGRHWLAAASPTVGSPTPTRRAASDPYRGWPHAANDDGCCGSPHPCPGCPPASCCDYDHWSCTDANPRCDTRN